MSQGNTSNRRMTIIVGLAVVIMAISLRALMTMENSLEEGRGPSRGILPAILPLMALMTALILLMFTQMRNKLGGFTTEYLRIGMLMAAMFVLGMLIEPAIPRPEITPGDYFGAIFILIPIFLIAVMLVPMTGNKSDEEE